MTKKASEKTIVGRFVNALHSATALISYRGIEFWSITDRYEKIAEQEREDAFVLGYLNAIKMATSTEESNYRYSLDDIRKTYNSIYHDGKNESRKIGIIGLGENFSKDEQNTI